MIVKTDDYGKQDKMFSALYAYTLVEEPRSLGIDKIFPRVPP
jgi:hypothetical protein